MNDKLSLSFKSSISVVNVFWSVSIKIWFFFSFHSECTKDIIDKIDLDLKGEQCDDVFH